MLTSKDEKGNTPFDIACFLGYKNIVLYFLKWGADPSLADLKGRNAFHFLLFKKEYETTMIVVNFLRHQSKEELFMNIKKLKRMFGFKNSDIKHGELVSTGFHSDDVLDRFNEFMRSIENLWVHTFQEYLKFLRVLFWQQDYNGRTPFHYSKNEKAIMSVLDIGFDKEEGFDDFKSEWQQLQNLEDPNSKPLDPKKFFHALNELKHFISPEVYGSILKDFEREKKLLIRDIMNVRDVCDETPLHIASRRGFYVLVSNFLKFGAQICKNFNGNAPLDIAKDKFTRRALTNLNEEAFKWLDDNITELIENGEDVNKRLTIFGIPPLHKAVDSEIKENTTTIRTLLDYNADINLMDYNGWTALHHASFKGDLIAWAELIQNGANVNAFSTSMKTPLHLAAYYNHPEIIHLLAQNGANLEGITNDEILHFSTLKHSILAENVAPLLHAAKRGNIEWFELLLKLGAYFYTTDIRKWNCLHYATYHNHLNMIRLILRLDYEQNGLRNMKNKRGNIPQHLWGCLKAKLIYDEVWQPEDYGEDEVDDTEANNDEPEIHEESKEQ